MYREENPIKIIIGYLIFDIEYRGNRKSYKEQIFENNVKIVGELEREWRF